VLHNDCDSHRQQSYGPVEDKCACAEMPMMQWQRSATAYGAITALHTSGRQHIGDGRGRRLRVDRRIRGRHRRRRRAGANPPELWLVVCRIVTPWAWREGRDRRQRNGWRSNRNRSRWPSRPAPVFARGVKHLRRQLHMAGSGARRRFHGEYLSDAVDIDGKSVCSTSTPASPPRAVSRRWLIGLCRNGGIQMTLGSDHHLRHCRQPVSAPIRPAKSPSPAPARSEPAARCRRALRRPRAESALQISTSP